MFYSLYKFSPKKAQQSCACAEEHLGKGEEKNAMHNV